MKQRLQPWRTGPNRKAASYKLVLATVSASLNSPDEKCAQDAKTQIY